jgi:hypothetical protein
MKKLHIIVVFLVLSIGSAFCQDLSESDSLSLKRQITIETQQATFQHLQFTKLPSFQDMNRLYRKESFDLSLNTPLISLPVYNTNHLALDLKTNLYSEFPLNDNSWISTARTSTDLIGLGGVYQVSANYNQKIGEFGILTGGVYAAKFNIYNNFYNNAGVNGNFKLILNDRLSLNIFGQYTPMTNTSMMQLMSPFYPQSNYGGSIEFKVNDKWGVVTGAEREFDVISRKWLTRPFIMPIFYKH